MDNNIDELRKKAGLTVQELADGSGYSRGYIQRLKKGAKRINQEVMERLAKPLRCKPEDIIAGSNRIAVAGHIGTGGEISFFDEAQKAANKDEVGLPPDMSPEEVVAVRIMGDVLFPVFQDGWVLYYSESPDFKIPMVPGKENLQVVYKNPTPEPLSEFFGKPCVVRLKDGRTMVRTLKRGTKPGHYTLASYNAPDIEDVVIEWAAKIAFVNMISALPASA